MYSHVGKGLMVGLASYAAVGVEVIVSAGDRAENTLHRAEA